MTKPQNLFSLNSLHNNFEDSILNMYYRKYKTKCLKNSEVYTLRRFIEIINDYSLLEGFHVGYIIEKIGEEFDFLKVTKDYVLNLEFKSKFNFEKIQKQQIKNHYYLKSLNKELIILTFEAENNSFYIFQDGKSTEISKGNVEKILIKLKDKSAVENLDNLFNPSNYLISPFNQTNRFLQSEYFLTKQQLAFQTTIEKYDKKIQVITGNPGTGKTLLLYDLIKKAIYKHNKVLIIHCGELNNGHESLKIKNQWNIKQAHHSWISQEESFYDLDMIFIDEGQRMYPHQLQRIINICSEKHIKLIVSIDPRQYLKDSERRYNNFEKLKELCHENAVYELSQKIRTNKELAAFVKCIFSGENFRDRSYDSITIDYLTNKDDFHKIVENLEEQGWKYLEYTTSKYTKGITYQDFSLNSYQNYNSHKVIGQEFDKVIILLDESFSFDENDKYIVYNGPTYYDARQMLYQNITRARDKIKFVIYNNKNLYIDLLSVITNTKIDDEIHPNLL